MKAEAPEKTRYLNKGTCGQDRDFLQKNYFQKLNFLDRETVIYKTRNIRRDVCHSPPKEASLLTPSFLLLASRTVTTNFCYLSYNQTNKLFRVSQLYLKLSIEPQTAKKKFKI